MNIQELISIKNSFHFQTLNDGKIATRNVGKIDPENINEYIGCDGYFALAKCLTEYTPDQIIEQISRSGLRGRGGAGFATGKKWQFAKNYNSNEKYVICNCDEGDPGAFMDRAILEGDPHSIVEAMCIAGYSIGAKTGIVYVRAEYPLACERIEKAIIDAKALGLLGNNILNKEFSFDIIIKKGAGAFVCGEETALINSCEGKRGEPNKKPPYPAEKGYLGKPTIINNIETLACINPIIIKGADWFASIGTETSKGTKVFALSGKINNPGLVEKPMGTTIREILEIDGGGAFDGKTFKAVQLGGPSGGCIPEQLFDTPIDYEHMKDIGTIMGSGGLIVMDNDTCMVDIAKFFLTFAVDESCGKCTPCREGNKKLLDILTRICCGQGKISDIEELENYSNYIISNSLCGLGQSSPNPVLSTLKYFKEEYIDHIVNHHCKAGVCKKLQKFVINKQKCIGCSKCARNCPVNCIKGELKKTYEINQQKCIKCKKCYDICPVKAVEKK